MHKLLVKNHRGSTCIEYIDFQYFFKNNLVSEYDLIILDKKLSDIDSNLKFIISCSKNIIQLDPGESIKTLSGVFDLLKTIDDLKIYPINRCLLIGGASLQDCVATGMSLLKRGTSWDYVPTTLLAQTDSCIGSKTSINSENTKNLYGLFYPPVKVFIIYEFLHSLPISEIVSGFGDAFHYLLVHPNNSFNYAIKYLKQFNKLGPENFIYSKDELNLFLYDCHKIKKYYIEKDEFDNNERKVLNLGHSFGHALEALLDFTIPHGIGVLLGINIAISFSLYLYESNIKNDIKIELLLIRKEIIKILDIYSPIALEKLNILIKKEPENFINILSRDKKNTSKDIFSLVLFEKNKFKIVKIEKSKLNLYIKNQINIFKY